MTADFNDEYEKRKRSLHRYLMQQFIKNKKERLKKECADANVSYVRAGWLCSKMMRQTKKKALVVVEKSTLCIGWHSVRK